jgi:Protein of unknown function (DUF4038)/Putative collagen-binding domain of a collagenase
MQPYTPSVDFSHGPLRVSSDGHYLQHADGTPFFWLGETAWEIFHRLTREETELFLETRRRQRFNVIQSVVLAEFNGLRTTNRFGEVPLIDLDPDKPNEAYFRHMDWVIDLAARKGLYIGLLPTWGDKVVRNAWGDGPIVFDESNARRFGEWLARRYASKPNLIWILGGDRPAIWRGRDGQVYNDDYRPLWRAMAAGIDAGTSGQALMSFHPSGGPASRTSRDLHNESWLDFNMMQSGHGGGHDVPVWDFVAEDYALTPTKPTLDAEPNYEDHPVNPWPKWDSQFGYYRDHDVRKQLYRSVFAGACGVTYGHHAVWQFFDEGFGESRPAVNYPDRPWRDAIERAGANQVQHLRALMESKPFFTRIPDQSILASDAGQGANHVQATRDSAGRYALIYVPNTQTVTVHMSAISGSTAKVSWFDPRTGEARAVGEYATTGTRFFLTPDVGPDWVLVLEAV